MNRGARHAKSSVMLGMTYVAATIATLPLLFIIFHLLRQGAAFIRPGFFTEMPKPVGEAGGGMANAIVGTLILIGTASVVGLPVGIGAGLYLADRRGNLLATIVRFLSDVLNGLPSIVLGIFACSGRDCRAGRSGLHRRRRFEQARLARLALCQRDLFAASRPGFLTRRKSPARMEEYRLRRSLLISVRLPLHVRAVGMKIPRLPVVAETCLEQ